MEEPKNSNHLKTSGNVLVVCRVRPMNKSEIEKGTKCCLDFDKNKKNITLNMSNEQSGQFGQNKFTFDSVFDQKASQKEVYDAAARPIIDSVLEGFNGTIFAYGQTSSGKTFTMQGPDIYDVEQQGIIPRMVRTVFNRIESASENIEFQVKVSMSEIYNEKIKDLLNPSKDNLKIHEEATKGVYIQDITEQYVVNDTEVYELMRKGNSNRSIAATNMNSESSRSHSLFVLTITMNNNDDGSCKTGKLFLVDLAGSEKIQKTGAVGQTLEEAKNINKSLTTLGKVIVALTDKKATHVPYRESKLTRILSESLGGNSKTCLIITASPHPFNEAETLSTLRFGARARNIKNAPKVNKEYTIPELKKLLEKSEQKVGLLEVKVKILSNQIQELGGSIPSENQLERMSMKIVEEKKIQESEEIETQSEQQDHQNDVVSLYDIDDINDQLNKTSFLKQGSFINAEQLQYKQDEIERLQELLEKEKECLNTQKKQMADLIEDCQISEERTNKAIAEQKRIQDKNQEYIDLIQNLQQKIKDIEIQIEEHEIKNQYMKEEHNIMRDVKDRLQNRIDQIYESNILILKQGKDNGGSEIQQQDQKQDFLLDNLQEEVRKLHNQLQLKDQIVNQLKLLINKQKLQSINEDGQISEMRHDSQLDEEINKIMLARDQIDSNDNSKQIVLQIIDILVSRDLLSESDIQSFTMSAFLRPQEIQQILFNHNTLLLEIIKLNEAYENLQNQKNELQNTLNQELQKKQPNIVEIVNQKVKQELEAQKKVFDREKQQLHKDLHNRVEKVLKLETELDEVKDAYKHLENTISREDLKFKQRAIQLEKNLDQLNQMYQNIASEKSILKVDLQVSERKIMRKSEQIQQLENQVKASKMKQQDYLEIIKQLKQEFLKVQSQQIEISQLTQFNSAQHKIQGGGYMQQERKTIRGGGGKKVK